MKVNEFLRISSNNDCSCAMYLLVKYKHVVRNSPVKTNHLRIRELDYTSEILQMQNDYNLSLSKAGNLVRSSIYDRSLRMYIVFVY